MLNYFVKQSKEEKESKEEIEKLLKVGYIKPIQHPIWLTNIIPVKKNWQIRRCVDFLA